MDRQELDPAGDGTGVVPADGRRSAAKREPSANAHHQVRGESSIVAQQGALRGQGRAGRDAGAREGVAAIGIAARPRRVALVAAVLAAHIRAANHRDIHPEVQAEPVLLVRTGGACLALADVAFSRRADAGRAVRARLAAGCGFANAAFTQKALLALRGVFALAAPV